MEQYYTDEKNVLIVISLLKQFGIKRIVASPGSTNVTFVGSVQQDSFFEIYSCVDERSAAYMACGMAAESGEPVVLSCTGATASRNYFSALTEAFYRKLPIVAITSTQDESKIGHLIPQVIDRSQQPKDIVKCSVHLQSVKNEDDEWDCMIKANTALLELNHHGIGPVHINLTTNYSNKFNIKDLPNIRKIDRYVDIQQMPDIPKGLIAIYVGSHKRWSDCEIKAIDAFCEKYDGVVFCDPTSNYRGTYKVNYLLMAAQKAQKRANRPDLLIHIGDMSDMATMIYKPKQVWRVSEDGKISDRYRALTAVFEMTEKDFFRAYSKKEAGNRGNSYLELCQKEIEFVNSHIPNLPFSHLWVASQLYGRFPKNSTIHLGILSPLRSWGYFPIDQSIEIYCNQGGFGIDGNMSTLIGASFIQPQKKFFGIVGDLSFFYDLNSLGNRHIKNNVRILLINNALGAEFHLFKQINSIYVDNIPLALSAGGHFGKQSSTLVKHYAEDLGFEYMSASNKEEFKNVCGRFVTNELCDKPMIFEIFTKVDDENESLWKMWHIQKDNSIKGLIKSTAKSFLGKD